MQTRSGLHSFTGIGRLTRLALRRDRLILPMWIIGVAILMSALAASVISAYPTPQDYASHAAANSPVLVSRLFNGTIYAVNKGVTVVSESLVFMLLFPALFSAMGVVRHTRQNEEFGRSELVGAAAVGQYASLGAALLVVFGANVVTALLTGFALMAHNLDTAGSFAVGAALGGVGLAFAGIAALTAQISTSARTANALAGAVLGLAFLVRGLGDALGPLSADKLTADVHWISWLSPLGWCQQIFPYGSNNWWALALPAGFFGVLALIAFRMASHRDIGSGVLAPKPGLGQANKRLFSPLGLAWRLQRISFWGWFGGVLVMGLTMGAVADQVDQLLAASPSVETALKALGTGDLLDVYLSLVMSLMAIIATGFIAQTLLRLRAEELEGRAENILATATPRARWLLGYVIVALLGGLAIIIATGIGTALVYGIITHTLTIKLGDLFAASLLQYAAMAAVGGIATLLVASVPRFSTTLVWSLLGSCMLVTYVGLMLKLPDWVMRLSPFQHIPAIGEPIPLSLLFVLAGITVGAIGLAALRFQHRDMRT